MFKNFNKDPHPLNAKFASKCGKCEKPIKKDDFCYYWPSTRSILCDTCGKPEYNSFLSSCQDEEVYNRTGNPW